MESTMNLHTGNPVTFGFRFATAVAIAITLWFGAGIYAPTAHAAASDGDQAMVDCMLPGQIQRLSNNVTIMGARHPIRTSRADCHVRGGEYYDADHIAKVHHKAHHAVKPVNSASTK
jgi:hypothetical protein